MMRWEAFGSILHWRNCPSNPLISLPANETEFEPGNFQVQRLISEHVIVTSQVTVVFLFSDNEIGVCGRVKM